MSSLCWHARYTDVWLACQCQHKLVLVFVVFVINYGFIVCYGCSENTLNKIIKERWAQIIFLSLWQPWEYQHYVSILSIATSQRFTGSVVLKLLSSKYCDIKWNPKITSYRRSEEPACKLICAQTVRQAPHIFHAAGSTSGPSAPCWAL